MPGSFMTISLAGRDYRAKVVSFNSTVTSQISSVQTQLLAQHFPHKVSQSTLSLTLQMRNKTEARGFYNLVRNSQLRALQSLTLVSLFWPQRDIQDWTGVILSVQAGERADVTSPVVSFDLLLVDSLVSRRTWINSSATDFDQIYAGEIPDVPRVDPSQKPTDDDPLEPPKSSPRPRR